MKFNQCELFISPRSPFARRVRLALLENKIAYREIICDVFKPTAELLSANPLVRVPVLRLASGEILIDSNLILQALYETLAVKPEASSARSLMPDSMMGRMPVYRWQAIAAGFAEKTVEYFLDTQRPLAIQDPEVLEELKGISKRIFTEVESLLSSNSNPEFLIGNSLTQADLDLGCALTYFGLRYSQEWKKQYLKTAIYLAKLEERPSFVQTFPPA
jgi:glutathione S-transferase